MNTLHRGAHGKKNYTRLRESYTCFGCETETGVVQYATKVMTRAPVYFLWKQGSSLLWPTVRILVISQDRSMISHIMESSLAESF